MNSSSDAGDSLPTWRLWGEEQTDGALFSVYLKKVRYHRPPQTLPRSDTVDNSTSSSAKDEISHLEWETVRVRFVKAGTLKKLVAALATDDGELESTYVNVFLATYRSFSTPKQVLDLLLERYEELLGPEHELVETVEQHKKTLVSALHVWLDTYPEDFRDAPSHPMLQQVLNFASKHLPGSELASKVRHRLDKLSRSATYGGTSNGGGFYCATPQTYALRNGHWPIYQLPDVPIRHFAEQLTRMDMELFKKLVPHQCLGAVWSRRDKNRSHDAATVVATVNQFNAVSFRVISSILLNTSLKPLERATILTAWIDIAQELRILKNFSSLKAIISGLQSNPVYRLQKSWQCLTKEKVELYDELARIFSEDNNQWTQRELLMREGTAKFADTVGENDKQLQKVLKGQNSGMISFGTIPYLGTFLTDLTMIDTAIPDTVQEGLINFDKRRKEFEVLAQIKLLQGAANAYHFPDDPAFDRWFDSILILDDREAYELSCQIESAPPNATKPFRKGPTHKKNDSIASTSSSNSSQFYCDLDSTPSSPHNSLDRREKLSDSSSTSSSLDASLGSCGSKSGGKIAGGSSDFYIIKVTYETDSVETDGIVLYKSIMLSNNERTPQVIRNAMLKLCLDGNPEAWTLAQVLPDKEMVLPSNANVYYAVNTAFNLNFILRPKRDQPNNGTTKKK